MYLNLHVVECLVIIKNGKKYLLKLVSLVFIILTILTFIGIHRFIEGDFCILYNHFNCLGLKKKKNLEVESQFTN